MAEPPQVPRILSEGAALTGLALLVPVPFLDEWLAERARARLVATLLARRGRTAGAKRVAPVWVNDGGCLSGCLLFPLKLVLWPLKKLFSTLFFVLALRSSALAVGRTLALGRAVDRALERGRLADAPAPAPGAPDPLLADARRVRLAIDRAFAGSDWLALRHALEASLRGVTGLAAGAAGLVRRALGKPAPAATLADPGLPAADRGLLERVTAAIGAAFEDPAAKAAVAEFDRRFDAALAEVDAAPPVG